MADIKLEPQEANHHFQDSLVRSLSPLQEEHKPGILSDTNSSHHEPKREDTPVVIDGGAVPNAPHNPHPINVPGYGMTGGPPPPNYAVPVVQHAYQNQNLNPGHVQGVPEHQRVVYPVNQGYHGEYCYARQRVIPRPVQVPVPYPPGVQPPARGVPASENLRRVANYYVQHPNSRVSSVSLERGTPGRYKVTIALEVTDIL